ncbi:MAG: hypothetical protein J3Q66DRAFT_7340 [Benniella sp.]|nr:MAG: hypothetical protein J3Q66DRAFT_7340 [Benniella sp.]
MSEHVVVEVPGERSPRHSSDSIDNDSLYAERAYLRATEGTISEGPGQDALGASGTGNLPQQDASIGPPEKYDSIDNDSLYAERAHGRVKEGTTTRWYFELTKKDPPVLDCFASYRSPVKINETERVTRLDLNAGFVQGLYNVRIAVNIGRLNVDRIDSISFKQEDVSLEVFTRRELKDLVVYKSGIVVLGLHHQCTMVNQYFNMEIRMSPSTTTKTDPGYIEIHYMELHSSQSDAVDDSKASTINPM